MQIRIRETGQVLLQHEWEKWVAMTYAKSLSGITEDIVNTFDSDILLEGPQASGGTIYQYSQRSGEEQIDGKWYTKYILGPVFTNEEDETAYKALKDAEQAANVRHQRDELLKETDWRFRSDMNPSQEWKDYCQALRDITTQPGFPWDVVYPTKPI